MQPCSLGHIGIVVKNIEDSISNLKKLCDIDKVAIRNYRDGELHYRIAFVELGPLELELIEPVNQKGMAQAHLDEFGPGVYHFAFGVLDLDKTAQECRDRRLSVGPIRRGAEGDRVVFLSESLLPGINIEFMEIRM